MDLGDRIVFFAIGCFIGFIFGYIVRSLKDIKEKVDHVDGLVDPDHGRDEKGLVRLPTLSEIALAVVVALAFFSAIASQRASNEVEETQNQLQKVTRCNQTYLSTLLKAVNQRTDTNERANRANVAVQKSWYEFVQFQLHVPPHPETEQRKKANAYAESLKHFLDVSSKSQKKVSNNPYPTNDDLVECINKKENK